MNVNRRESLVAIGVATALASSPLRIAATETKPRIKIGTIPELKKRGTLSFSYESGAALAVLLASGTVKAYSTTCTHMGCAVDYDSKSRQFACPCHQSRFAADRHGSVASGPAPRPLPEIALEVADNGDIYATGISAPTYGQAASRAEVEAIYEAEAREES
jgi:cytochrome b6-f complex iron-sulfur subunit